MIILYVHVLTEAGFVWKQVEQFFALRFVFCIHLFLDYFFFQGFCVKATYSQSSINNAIMYREITHNDMINKNLEIHFHE